MPLDVESMLNDILGKLKEMDDKLDQLLARSEP